MSEQKQSQTKIVSARGDLCVEALMADDKLKLMGS